MQQRVKTALLLINQRSRKGRIDAARATQLLQQSGLILLEPAYDDSRPYAELITAYAS